VVRTVDEIVELEVGLVVMGQLEFLSDPVQRSAHLLAHGPGPFTVDLDKAVLRLFDRTVLLLDDEHLTGLVHDDEVELTELDPVPVFSRPVHAVKDGVGGREFALEFSQWVSSGSRAPASARWEMSEGIR
jgi:hypothetical protein